MTERYLIAVAVTGTTSTVSITVLGHDYKIAAMLDHPAGTGRWIDKYEVKRSADLRLAFAGEGEQIPAMRATVTTLEEARLLARELYRDAADRAANDAWARAEAGVPHFQAG